MKIHRALALSIPLLLQSSAASACPAPEFEELVVGASFIGRVVLSNERVVRQTADWGEWDMYVYDATVLERVRGHSGRLTVASGGMLGPGEALVVGDACPACGEGVDVRVSVRVPFSLEASLHQAAGRWFDAADLSPAEFRVTTLDLAEGPRNVVSWRELERRISGSEDYLACRAREAERWQAIAEASCGSPAEAVGSWWDCASEATSRFEAKDCRS